MAKRCNTVPVQGNHKKLTRTKTKLPGKKVTNVKFLKQPAKRGIRIKLKFPDYIPPVTRSQTAFLRQKKSGVGSEQQKHSDKMSNFSSPEHSFSPRENTVDSTKEIQDIANVTQPSYYAKPVERQQSEEGPVEQGEVFLEQEEVLAQWHDRKFYPATVLSSNHERVVVKFIEDGVVHTVKKTLVKRMIPTTCCAKEEEAIGNIAISNEEIPESANNTVGKPKSSIQIEKDGNIAVPQKKTVEACRYVGSAILEDEEDSMNSSISEFVPDDASESDSNVSDLDFHPEDTSPLSNALLEPNSCANTERHQSTALQENNQPMVERSANFLKLHQMDFNAEITVQARRDRIENERTKEKITPLSKDVVKLNNHLKSLSKNSMEVLSSNTATKEEKVSAWVTLQKVTLTQLLVFNRRREGEVSRMIVEDFRNKKDATEKSDIGSALNQTERALCQLLTRIEIQGKRNRTVPVLLTPLMKKALDMLLKWREFVGVCPENKFLFASCYHGAKFHYRGAVCLTAFAQECGAKSPESLRSTKLRKHVATISQILNLKDNELDTLANFMGHDICIHRKFYRLPDEVMQVAKLSKIFIALDKGHLQTQTGKSLQEIEAVLDEDITSDVGDESVYSDEGEEDEGSETEDSLTDQKEPTVGKWPKKVTEKAAPCRRMWTPEEKAAVEKHLLTFILRGELPGASTIHRCIAAEPVLASRQWKNVKDFCRNQIVSRNRK